MRQIPAIFGIFIGLMVYAAMVYADFADDYRYGRYWLVESGANILLGFSGFIFSLLCSGCIAWRRSAWIPIILFLGVALMFGLVGHQIALHVYHASWHEDKAWQTLILIACLMTGFVFCGLYFITEWIADIKCRRIKGSASRWRTMTSSKTYWQLGRHDSAFDENDAYDAAAWWHMQLCCKECGSMLDYARASAEDVGSDAYWHEYGRRAKKEGWRIASAGDEWLILCPTCAQKNEVGDVRD